MLCWRLAAMACELHFFNFFFFFKKTPWRAVVHSFTEHLAEGDRHLSLRLSEGTISICSMMAQRWKVFASGTRMHRTIQEKMQCVSDCHGFNNINTKPRKVRLGAGGWSCACLDGSEAMSKQFLKDAKNDPRKHKREFISLGHGAKLKKKKSACEITCQETNLSGFLLWSEE